ncbi:precorrin-2 C(20)-methyltransferase [Anaerotruncus colihominis]|uniref:Precorrin-2 C(20)-methyltransferase n=1 Tax=Anaerotruncus colihominis TaxID=169435 RepID=A0A845RJB5_9FIRM|nr:precorrin-2 C(20)-methyltransferase [Anaerotruncus colihominis]NBI77832.1 precorrin-2 C(20)-methyltransferase [Anaerotruncus colihominis]
MSGIFYGVSVGPGDPELLTLKAVRIIRACDVIAVPRSSKDGEQVALEIARAAVPELLQKEIVPLDMPMTHDAAVLEKARAQAAETVLVYLEEGRDVAFLTIGDVSIYSTYGYLHNRVVKRGYTAKMVAGVPSFCAAAACLGESLTEPKLPVHLIPAAYGKVAESLDLPGTKVLMKSGKTLEQTIDALRARGRTDARVVQRCGLPGERVFYSLDEWDNSREYLSIVIVKDC